MMYKLFNYIILLFSFTTFAQINYVVKAKNGLFVRSETSTKSKKIDKINYEYKFQVSEDNIYKADTIIDNNYKIAGHWVSLKTEKGETGYVFDGYLREIIEDKGKNKRNKLKLLGLVKTIVFSSFYANREEDIKYDYKYVFNKNGNILEKYNYKSDNTIYLDDKYTYDSKNRLIEKDDITYSKTKMKYNNKDKITEQYYETKGKPYYKWMYTYNEKGNLTEEEDYYYDRMSSKRYVYFYNNEGKKIRSEGYYYGEKHIFNRNYEYDMNGRLVKETFEDLKKDTILTRKEYSYNSSKEYDIEIFKDYNDKGLLKEQITKAFDKNKILRKLEKIEREGRKTEFEAFFTGYVEEDNIVEYIYNSKGKLIIENIYILQNGEKKLYKYYKFKNNHIDKYLVNIEQENEFEREEFFYDYKGNLIKKIDYREGDGTEIYSKDIFEYIFDERNNWIEKKEYNDDKLYKIERRELTYH